MTYKKFCELLQRYDTISIGAWVNPEHDENKAMDLMEEYPEYADRYADDDISLKY